MSIIIRLQNLPLSARSGDIRKFFGGLRIPDGGVHILGGDKGDAFIVFMSDEDARIAMRKDGGRIKDSRIKLFLSSHMEMQHEVGKITKDIADAPYHKDRTLDKDFIRGRSPERRRRSRSRSPLSPVSYHSGESTRYMSRSPRRRSRSPIRSHPSQRFPSSKSKSFIQRRKSSSPKARNYAHSVHTDDDLSHSSWKNPKLEFPYQSDPQAELEKRITAELEKNSAFRNALNEHGNLPFKFQESFKQSVPLKKSPNDLIFQSSDSSSMHHFPDAEFKQNFSVNRNQLENLSSGVSLRNNKEKQNIDDCYFISLSGMDPKWGFREVQLVLKGIFAPQNNIRWELDDAGYKTRTAFVKLTNKEDYESVLKKTAFYFNNHRISVSECPTFVVQNYFQTDSEVKNEKYIPKNRNLCYILKGLPFSCKYEDIIAFFEGFEIADVTVFYGDDGRATGTGFVAFTNWKDFQGAIALNGKKIGHRYIEMLPSTDKEMSEAKKTQPGGIFVPYSQIISEKKLPASRRPLCAILTGLPLNINTRRILSFFAESGLKPDAVHLTLSKKKLSDGRAFVEFTNFLDFDLALKFHGKRLNENTVCVKQILYDEMVKILDSQKAKHYFETQTPSALATNVPEKVPYLWDPPDEEQEKGIYGRDNRPGFSSNKLPGDLNISAFPHKRSLGDFPPNVLKQDFGSRYKQAVTSTMTNILQPNIYQNATTLGAFGMNAKNTGGFVQNPILFNNSKQFMTPQHNDMFQSTKKYEDNIKLSRLSPENEAVLLDFLNKDRKFSPVRNNNNRRSRSLERRSRDLYVDKTLDELERYYEEENFSMPRSKDNFRIRNERDYKHYDDKKHDFHDRSPRSSPLHEDEDEKCVVQLSNVDVSVGTRDLIKFLHGFDFYKDTLIRRYDESEPTPDVRVTFKNIWEAKRAIKILNRNPLHGMRVDMFIV